MKRRAKCAQWTAAIALAGSFASYSVYTPTAMAQSSYTDVVNPNIQYQTWEGFGTSLAWWANVIGGASSSITSDYANLVFSLHPSGYSANKGLGLNVVRYNIGGGENPAYLPPNSPVYIQYRARVPGYEPSSGNYNWSADANQRNILKLAMARGVNVIGAASYSPPYWMTNSGSSTGAVTAGDDNLNSNYYQSFADYLTTVTKHFHDDWDVNFRTLEPINEPHDQWHFGGHQEACSFSNSSIAKIIPLVAQDLKNDGLATTETSTDDLNDDYAVNSLGAFNSTEWADISKLNVHQYGGSNKNLPVVHTLAQTHSKDLWMSEYGDNDATGMKMASTIINDLRNLKPSAWVYWQAVGLSGSGWPMLETNLNNPPFNYAYTINEKYYVMGNFSKFIRPGDKFIAINDGNSVAAYDQADHKLVIVTQNNTSNATSVTYDLSRFGNITGTVTPYQTDPTENLAQLSNLTLSGGKFTGNSPADSVTTYVITGVNFTLQNQVQNGGFETGSLGPWVVSAGSAGVESNHPFKGKYDAYMHPSSSSYAGIDQNFTAPVTGTYTFSAAVSSSNGIVPNMGINVNGKQVINENVTPGPYEIYNFSFHANAGDKVSAWFYAPKTSLSGQWVNADNVSVSPPNWVDAGGVLSNSPALSSQGQHQLDAFVTGTNGSLYWSHWNGSTWSAYTDLGAPGNTTVNGSPAAVSWANGRIDVFVRGEYNNLWQISYNNGTWSSWQDLGGQLADSPAVSSQGLNELDVFVRGTNNALYQDTWNGSTWSGFTDLGGPNSGTFQGSPAAVSWGSGRIDVFVRGTDNQLWHTFYSGGKWYSKWQALGGVLASSPRASSEGYNELDVFVRGSDNALYRMHWNGSTWSSFIKGGGPTNGTFVDAPAAVSPPGSGKTDVAVRGNDNALYQETVY